MEFFPLKKAYQIFGRDWNDPAIDESRLPSFARSLSDNRQLKSWTFRELPAVGEIIGFLEKPSHPVAIAVFVTKGGVLKSTLTLNLARMAALHGIRTCVVGLDMQGDITTALSSETYDDSSDDETSLSDALAKFDALRGLADVFSGDVKLEDVVLATEIPSLSYIPETPELVALDQSLIHRNRREYWLKERVVQPLKEQYDLILLDCSPNWNRLITNALVACDVLISPLECKINNFRNFKTFQGLLKEFKDDMRSEFRQIFVPTRFSPNRKLSREIYEWYRANLQNCSETAIRESLQGEEAMAMRLSIPEYAPSSAPADEMRNLLREIWPLIIGPERVIERVEIKQSQFGSEASI